MSDTKISVSIVGATGYTGSELLRIFMQHPGVNIKYLTSRQHQYTPVVDVFPRLAHIKHLFITNTEYSVVARESDVVFLCLPHMASQQVIGDFIGKTRVIDMSADFRLDSSKVFKKYYDAEHLKPKLLNGRFVYGFPELNPDAISQTDAVANPGCNALLVQLMLLPFAGVIQQANVSLLTGTTGGGRQPRDPIDHPVLSANVRSYMVNCHRHTPEILRTACITEQQLNFTPTVGPYLRGLFATAFLRVSGKAHTDRYDNAPFIRIRDNVELSNVVSTNYCDLSYQEGHGGVVLVQGAMDNLLRGAAGTAVQNMNLMFGLQETTGLTFTSPVYP